MDRMEEDEATTEFDHYKTGREARDASIDEGRQAKEWRQAMGLTIQTLAELTGYSGAAISLFERGCGSNGRPHPEKSRRKFKLTCLAICFLKHYQMTLEDWPWQAP